MASLVYELPETYASVVRPVAFEVIKQLIDKMGIDVKELPIFVPGVQGKLTQWNSEHVEKVDTAHFQAKTKLIAEINEEYLEDDLPVMLSKRLEHPPFFWDKEHDIRIAPVYTRNKVIISMKYTTKDRWEAESTRDHWRRKLADFREYMMFTARYKYPVPVDIEKALYLLWRTRNKMQNEFEKWTDYLFHFGSSHLVSVTNSAGKGDVLALAEEQVGIQGHFTDPTSITVEKDDIGGSWLVSFDFEYQYDKPIACSIHYPLAINSKLVPPQLYPELVFDVRQLQTAEGLTRAYYDCIQDMSGLSYYSKGAFIRIPEFDDWVPDKMRIGGLHGTQPLVSIMILVDDNDKCDVCNLKDLGKWGLNERLHQAFMDCRRYLTSRHEFPFYLTLHENDVLMEKVVIDKELNVRTTFEMNPKKIYHLTIHANKHINHLSKEGQRYFFEHPELVYAWMDIVMGRQPEQGYPQPVNGKIRYQDFENTIKREPAYHRDGLYYQLGQMFATVGVFSVAPHSRQNINQPVLPSNVLQPR